MAGPGSFGNARRHGHTVGKHLSNTYNIWNSMKSRCRNPNVESFPRYGGRGIGYDLRWELFDTFLADMGERPSGLSLERKNNDLGYSKENCKWATKDEQNRNRRDNRFITYQGETLTMAEWVRKTGIRQPLLWRRLNDGWPVELAFSKKRYIRVMKGK